MTFPDTPDIATAAEPVAPAAAERLRLLHRLGQTAESAVESLRQARDAAEARAAQQTAYADATAAVNDALRTEVAALRDELNTLRAPRPYIPVNEFRLRLIPLRLALLAASDEVKARWSVILPELDRFSTVEPSEPRTAGLIDLAVADGLLTAEQAAALRQV